MDMKKTMKISKGGQISIPASIRHKWATSRVTIEERGGRLIVTPAPDDPIAAAEGALSELLPDLDVGELRRAARQDDRAAEARRR